MGPIRWHNIRVAICSLIAHNDSTRVIYDAKTPWRLSPYRVSEADSALSVIPAITTHNPLHIPFWLWGKMKQRYRGGASMIFQFPYTGIRSVAVIGIDPNHFFQK